MATVRPADLPSAGTVTAGASLVVDSGSAVERATPAQIVDAALPLASQAEAEAGTDNAKRVTPLRVKQAIDALGVSAETLASTASGKGAALIGFKADITGSKARDLAIKVGETHVDALDFATPGDSDAAQTTGLANLFANAPAGANIHFPNKGTFKTNSKITLTKQFNIHGGGSQIWGLEGNASNAVLEYAVTEASNGNGDVRRMLIENLDVLAVDVGTGATGPALKITSPVGVHQTVVRGCYLGTTLTTSYAVVLQSDIFAIASGSEQFSTSLQDCTINNGLHLNKLSDAFRSLRCNYQGTKRNLVDMTGGAFCTLFDHDKGLATEGFLKIIGGSQLEVVGTQIEGVASSGAFIEVDASTYDMSQLAFRRINFGAGAVRNLILKGSKNLSQVEIDGCTFGYLSGTLVYDIDIQSASVRDTIIRRNQMARNDRMGTGFAPDSASYAAEEAAKTGSHDATDLLLINDSGTGTRGIWQPSSKIGFNAGWMSDGQFKFMKDENGMVHCRGGIQSGTTTDGTIWGLFPEGFRPLEVPVHVLPAGATGTMRNSVSASGYAGIDSGGATPIKLAGLSFYAPNSRFLPGA